MTKTIAFLFVSGFLILLTSCLDVECVQETRAYMKVSFYNYETKTVASPDNLSLYGANNTIKIYDNQKITLPALIPLKDSDNESEFIIEINGTEDTIRFVHSSFLNFISKECGYSMWHTIDTVYFTTNEIDSISLINKEITLKNANNVAIFY